MMTDAEKLSVSEMRVAIAHLEWAYDQNSHAILAEARQDLAAAWRAVNEDAIEALALLREDG